MTAGPGAGETGADLGALPVSSPLPTAREVELDVLQPRNVRDPRGSATRDPDSHRWLAQLRSDGAPHDRALRHLHELLLKMAYARLMPRLAQLRRETLDELALEAADEALVAVLAHLDDFRGASRFTTWACQFAVNEVSVAMRRYRRHQRELPTEPEVIVLLTGSRSTVERQLEQTELLRLVCDAVNEGLTEYQRDVLLALTVRGETPHELAAELGTNAGALYKSLHDARRKVRARLAAQGMTPTGDPVVSTRGSGGKKSTRRDSNASGTMGAADRTTTMKAAQ